MAKKNTRSDKSATLQPAPERRRTVRATTRKTTPSSDAILAEPEGSPAIGIDTANDLWRQGIHTLRMPTHEEIAEAAYRRYLERGGADGQDFDDWLHAERSLAERS